ncbi:DUF5707 domain-containing protein [Streptomyces sp. NPDC047000]|uniref:DUF5707 domain-containing protein n=1 Tax=Streptomyces sp. NPDC047000 TaxID=3155474 RepID=UPI0033DA7ABB
MRIHASVGIVTAALALSSLAVPAAQAASGPAANPSKPAAFASVAKDVSRGDTAIVSSSVGGANTIVMGATQKKTVTITVTATDDSGIQDAFGFLWHGPSLGHADGVLGPDMSKAQVGDCYKVTAKMSACEVKVVVDAKSDLHRSDALAGTWHIWAGAVANDGDYVVHQAYGTAQVQRAAQLTLDAAPEPVKKGKTLTVTGRLTRASWAQGKNVGYAGQSVKLQFRKKGSKTFTKLKTVKTDSKGNLRTTVKATVDGDYRYEFHQNSTTSWGSSRLDFVDVK